MRIESDTIDLCDLLNPKNLSSQRFSEDIAEKMKKAVERGEEIIYTFNYKNGHKVYKLILTHDGITWKQEE